MRPPRTPRWLAPALLVAFAVLLIGVALFLWSQGLDKADAWASVLSALAGLTSLAAAAYTGIRHRATGDPPAAPQLPASVTVSGQTGAVVVGDGNIVTLKKSVRS